MIDRVLYLLKKAMAQITFEYDGRNQAAKKAIDLFVSLGLFKIKSEQDEEKSPYSPEFVQQIQKSRASKGKVIKTEDLWK
ncbi:MAG TPA: hypothetical protein PKH79_12625 [Prolixibacteraceae bacterium]|nr:hypothetical protein [Prolixibacteraceae bacterium]HPS12917.1 hypothetical protein [Prolixibacteraceae bacterium]